MSANPIKDGGPAFPVIADTLSQVLGAGMSLRDYFIAHAPAEPQTWFEPTIAPRPDAPVWPKDRTPEEGYELDGWNEGYLDIEDLTQPRIKSFAEAKKAYAKALPAWEATRTRERYIQWPAAWADAMLKAREA